MLLLWQQPPSREEIVARAREYGMVYREEVLPLLPGTEDNPLGGQALDGHQVVELETEILVSIPPGASLEEIAILLEREGIIAAAVFEAEARRQGVQQKLKAGSYYLPRDDLKEIIRRLTG